MAKEKEEGECENCGETLSIEEIATENGLKVCFKCLQYSIDLGDDWGYDD